MDVRRALIGINILLLFIVLVHYPVSAQGVPNPLDPSLIPASGNLGGDCNFVTGIFRASCIPAYLRYLIRLIFMFIGTFFLISIIIAGYQIALGSVAAGQGGADAGKSRLRWAIIGFLVSAFAFFIIDFFVCAINPAC